MKVFLSYSRQDAEFIDRLDRELSGRGYEVWVDREDIAGGGEDRWRRSIVRAIRDSDVMVLVLSPNSVVSEHVERELSVAADNGRRVVPVLLRECQIPDGFQYELAGLQYVDFGTLGFEAAMRQLTAQLGQPTGREAPPATGLGPSGATSAPVARATDRRRRRTLTLAGVGVVAVAVAGIALALALGGGDDEDDAQEQEPTVSTAPTEEEQARDLIEAWAAATTARDWEEAARIDTSGTIDKPYDEWYLDPSFEMISINPYLPHPAMQEGGLWKFEGAVMANDLAESGVMTTNVVCSWWEVDLAAGTAAWHMYPERVEREQSELRPDQYDAAYQTHCA